MSKDVMLWTGAGEIGLAIARRMGYGMKIVVGDKSLQKAERNAKLMQEAGYDIVAVEVDISSRASIKQILHVFHMER